MLLALLGEPLSRRDAHRRFGTRRRGWTPPDIDVVASTVRRIVGDRRVVVSELRFDSGEALAAGLASRLRRVPALLMAARCRLLPERVTARHAVVVTGVSKAHIALVDPLCRRPAAGSLSNNTLERATGRDRYLRTGAGAWQLDLRSCVDLLEVRPRERESESASPRACS